MVMLPPPAQLSSFVDLLGFGVVFIDEVGDVRRVNDAAQEMLDRHDGLLVRDGGDLAGGLLARVGVLSHVSGDHVPQQVWIHLLLLVLVSASLQGAFLYASEKRGECSP